MFFFLVSCSGRQCILHHFRLVGLRPAHSISLARADHLLHQMGVFMRIFFYYESRIWPYIVRVPPA